jgi:hypothetical protein
MTRPKIVNTYHKQSFSGIGDFFRGSIYLYYRCKDSGIRFSLSLCDHPISKHIKFRFEDTCDSSSIHDIPINFSNSDRSLGLSKFSALELDKTFDFLSGMQGGKKFIFSNYHEIMNIPPISLMNHINSIELSEDVSNWFKKNIYFSDAIEDAVDSYLNFKDFNVIHFRLGDTNSFCENKTDFLIDEEYFLSIINRQEKKNTIIISDNNQLKSFFIKNRDKISLPIFVPHSKSSHTQKNTGLESLEVGENSEFYTAFDLKLLSMASKVTGYSSYYWGTGFSCWISKLFSVPFSCKPFMKDGKLYNY